jgi:phosphoglycolate phosphatase-like HAD superfamily hydrolase
VTRSVDAVGFDLDGTLVDTMAVAPSVYARVVRSLGGPDLTAGDITGIWHIGPTSTVLGHFLRRPIMPADLELFHDTFEDATRSVEPFDGVATMLRALRDHRYHLGVYTTATRRAAATLLAATGLADLVGAVVGGDEVTEPKPAADGLRRLAHALGTTPGRIAYVGDTSIDSSARTRPDPWASSRPGARRTAPRTRAPRPPGTPGMSSRSLRRRPTASPRPSGRRRAPSP